MIFRLPPRNGGQGQRAQRQDQDSQTRDVHPGAEGDAAERDGQRAEFGQQEERDPESADRSEKECRRGCGGRQTHISRREQMRGGGQVGEAQYRRGPLLGGQVAERRKESSQLSRPRPQIRGLRRSFRRLDRQFRRHDRLLARARRGFSSREPAHASGDLMRKSPGVLRAGRGGPRPPSAVPWRLSGPQLFTSRS